MIPVRLVLRNFLSYAEPDPIDFTGFEIACLTGDNGAGKSALLDAMSYAMFGAARGCEGGKDQERLIRDGADELLVEFTFELNGTTYRITRTRARPKRGSAKGNDIRFQAFTGEASANLAKETARETQSAIHSLVRMDYRTFVTSAFFLQNRADDFLTMDRADRKKVFAKLLDLDTYERLEAAARERSRSAERKRAALGSQAERLGETALDPSALETELAEAAGRAEATRRELRDAEARAEVHRTEVARLEQEAAVLDAERRALAELERRLTDERRAIEAKRAEVEEIASLLARSDEVREALTEMERLRTEDSAGREAQARRSALREEASVVASRIDNERATIEARRRARKTSLAKLTAERKQLEKAAAELTAIERALCDLEGVDAAAADTKDELERQRLAEAGAREELAQIETKNADVQQKLALLDDSDGACPVCGEPLDTAHRRAMTTELRGAIRQLGADKQRAHGARDLAAKEVRRLSEELDRLTAAQREHSRLAAKREAMAGGTVRLQEVGSEIAQLANEDGADEQLLSAQSYAAPLRAELAALEERIAAAYDAGAHEKILERLEELRGYERIQGRLLEAQERSHRVAAELEAAADRAGKTSAEAGERRASISAMEAALAGLDGAKQGLAGLAAAAGELRKRCAAEDAEIARIEERLAGARRAAEEVRATRVAEVDAATEHRRYDMLATAFGRGGIPDRIIANALPELRDEANDILGRLSDFEMSLQFRMDKETKSGKVKETFDVLVHHDGGTPRDYSMFSGGEAFRIAFAVRLALSKLLVHRAGARLETLVIDEGFGTQDPGGRERLIEAINLARSEFARVLVITHLDDLKDVFGTQIRVTKDDVEGSRLDIVPG